MVARSRLLSLGALLVLTTIGIVMIPDTSSEDRPPGAMVTLETYDIETGEPVTGACFSLEGELNGACDGDGSGSMTFAQPIPPGTYEVGYERTALGSHLAVGNFPLIVPNETSFTMRVAFITVDNNFGQWNPSRGDITLVPVIVDLATPAGTPAAGGEACFIIHGGSVNDIHGDVSFCGVDSGAHPVQAGTYLLTSDTCAEPNSGMWIGVTGDATIEVPLLADGCIAS